MTREGLHVSSTEQTTAERKYLADIVDVPGQDTGVRNLVDDLFKSADAGAFSAMHKICDAVKPEPTAEQP